MTKKMKPSFTAKVVDAIRKTLLWVLKAVYIIPFFAFGLILIGVVYFPEYGTRSSIEIPEPEEIVVQIISQKRGPVPRDHFHMIDAYVDAHLYRFDEGPFAFDVLPRSEENWGLMVLVKYNLR